jgi:hypothetical protein
VEDEAIRRRSGRNPRELANGKVPHIRHWVGAKVTVCRDCQRRKICMNMGDGEWVCRSCREGR